MGNVFLEEEGSVQSWSLGIHTLRLFWGKKGELIVNMHVHRYFCVKIISCAFENLMIMSFNLIRIYSLTISFSQIIKQEISSGNQHVSAILWPQIYVCYLPYALFIKMLKNMKYINIFSLQIIPNLKSGLLKIFTILMIIHVNFT